MPTRLIQKHNRFVKGRFFKEVIDHPEVADALIHLAVPPVVKALRTATPGAPKAEPQVCWQDEPKGGPKMLHPLLRRRFGDVPGEASYRRPDTNGPKH